MEFEMVDMEMELDSGDEFHAVSCILVLLPWSLYLKKLGYQNIYMFKHSWHSGFCTIQH